MTRSASSAYLRGITLLLCLWCSRGFLQLQRHLHGMKFSSSVAAAWDQAEEDAIGRPLDPLPSVSSKINHVDNTGSNMKYDLWVAGAGTLGEIVCRLYKEKYPDAKVVAETATTNRHDRLQSYGVMCKVRSTRNEEDVKSARNLIIAFPPSSAADYAAEVSEATRLWAGPMTGGTMAFTSSSAVYGDSEGNIVDEAFRLDTRSARSTK